MEDVPEGYRPMPHIRPLSRAAATFPAGANQIRLAVAGDFSSGGGGGIRRDLVNGGTSHY